jgi:phosphoribosyl 1,2-cyclic phosphodiesterase
VRNPKQLQRYWRRAPVSEKITYGGNTSCVEVRHGDAYLILDAGSGLCRLGRHMLDGRGRPYGPPCHLFLTHYHWDHIMGFPFFRSAYIAGNRVIIHSQSPEAGDYFRAQQRNPFFPASLEFMPARISFETVRSARKEKVGPFMVTPIRLQHPGGSVGYKIRSGEESLVYLTDVELLKATPDESAQFRDFVKGVQVAIVDAQYGVLESHEKTDWGHSTAFHWIDLMHDTGVKDLFLFHYEPLRSDEEISEILKRAREYLRRLYPTSRLKIHASYEGQRFVIKSS